MVEKGIVSSVEGTGARVIVPTRNDYVTENLTVPPYVTGLQIDDIVAFVEFGDLTGVILSKLEG